MQVYLVGGAVRDELLGLIVKDKDFVVVGSTPDEMIAAGFKPVGKDFPVFLHPKTHDEYALARTERKTDKGYKGFVVYASPEVTLEEDLARRDLTINAIAKDSIGKFIDPYNGLADIQSKILRHVSDAFAEDPVRILRAARLSARFQDFSLAPETNQLMQQMVEAGEVDALVAERVWKELAKGLMEDKPSRMFDVLRTCCALKKILPELDKLWGVPQSAQYHPEIDTGVHVMLAIDYAARQNYALAVRFATLMHDLGKGVTPAELLPQHTGHEARGIHLVKEVCKRLRVPNYCKELAQIVSKFHGKLHQVLQMKPSTLLSFIVELDAIRQPERFKDFLRACESDLRGRTGLENHATPAAELMLKVLAAAMNVDAGAVASAYDEPEKIKAAVYEARLDAVKKTLLLL
ncbi:MAG: multifunctional CCA addition/repair protein [Methylotenera sp.]|nr:multifunctional CCA addition/repair protein [Methylotenera sp.]MSP98949.1 multifunctional CCA addition/repair protein [Methylotenera sp.]